VLTGPFSPLFGPFFRAKRAGPARLGPLRAGLGQKLKPAGSAGPARFWPGFTGPGPGRAGPARLAISNRDCLVELFSNQLFREFGCGDNLSIVGLCAEKDECVHMVHDLESDGILLYCNDPTNFVFMRLCCLIFTKSIFFRSELKS
jgi:hypothetical protein